MDFARGYSSSFLPDCGITFPTLDLNPQASLTSCVYGRSCLSTKRPTPLFAEAHLIQQAMEVQFRSLYRPSQKGYVRGECQACRNLCIIKGPPLPDLALVKEAPD